MRRIILTPKTLMGRAGLFKWSCNSLNNLETECEENPFRVIVTPQGDIAKLLSSGDIDAPIEETNSPIAKVKSFGKNFAGKTFRSMIEGYIRSSVQRSQRLKKTDFEVLIE